MNKHYIKARNVLLEVDKMMSHFGGIDYAFLYAKDLNEKDAINTQVTSEENLPKINTWIVQDVEKIDLIPEVLTPLDLQQTCAIIVIDFDQPWEMKNQLQKWMGALQETIFQLMPKLPLQVQDSIKNKIQTFVKTYEDPELDENGKLINKVKTTAKIGEKAEGE